MPRARDLLERFKPAGTPGAAAHRGVPVDRVAEFAAELEPVLAKLSETADEADQIRAQGRLEAERRRAAAVELAQATLASAASLAAADRAQEATRLSRASTTETAETLGAAERAVGELRQRAAARLPALVDEVVAAVGSGLGLTSR